jgi:hypothetical protein
VEVVAEDICQIIYVINVTGYGRSWTFKQSENGLLNKKGGEILG